MTGPFLLFYDAKRKKDMPINAAWVTHMYATNDVDGEPACEIVMGGNSLVLTVRGDIVNTYRRFRDLPSR